MSASPPLVHFTADMVGKWAVVRVRPVRGPKLAWALPLAVIESYAPPPGNWSLRGVVNSLRS